MIVRFLLLCLAIASFSALSSQAQDVVGFRVGLNVASIDGDLNVAGDFGSRIGFVAGLFGTVPLRHGFSVQPELLYAQRGFSTGRATIFNADEPDVGNPISARLELTYIDVPLLIKYAVPLSSEVSLSFHSGPMISFELSERIVIDGLQGSQEYDQFGSPEYGLALGSDLTCSLAGIEGLVGVRFSRGLGNVLDQEVSVLETRSIRNESLVFFIGLHLRQ